MDVVEIKNLSVIEYIPGVKGQTGFFKFTDVNGLTHKVKTYAVRSIEDKGFFTDTVARFEGRTKPKLRAV